MNKDNYVTTAYNTPFIAQRADPYILHHEDRYYFTASVPEYDRIILREFVELLRERLCILSVPLEKQDYPSQETYTGRDCPRSGGLAKYGTQAIGLGSR